MPLHDWNDPSTWAQFYSVKLPDERWGYIPEIGMTIPCMRLGYNRAVLFEGAAAPAQAFIDILSITAADTVVIVGAGFGWTAEHMMSIVPGLEVVGTEVSTFVHGKKDQPEDDDLDAAIAAAGLDPGAGYGAQVRARHRDGGNRCRVTVANEDLGNSGSRGRVRRLFATNSVTVGISELVLDTMEDAEIADNIGRIAAIDPSNLRVVAHYLATAEHGATAGVHNVKTRDEWRAFIDAAGGTDHVLIELGSFAHSNGAGQPWLSP